MNNDQAVINKIDKGADKFYNDVYHHHDVWVHDIVVTWRWWVGVILTFLPWIFWFFYRKKESTDRYLCCLPDRTYLRNS
jgi:hypothetical protein